MSHQLPGGTGCFRPGALGFPRGPGGQQRRSLRRFLQRLQVAGAQLKQKPKLVGAGKGGSWGRGREGRGGDGMGRGGEGKEAEGREPK